MPRTTFSCRSILFGKQFCHLRTAISEVLEYPTTEFNYWAVVFQEEYYEAHPHERFSEGMAVADCKNEIKKFKEMMNFQSETKSTTTQSDFFSTKVNKK
jgi:hypothetical protein